MPVEALPPLSSAYVFIADDVGGMYLDCLSLINTVDVRRIFHYDTNGTIVAVSAPLPATPSLYAADSSGVFLFGKTADPNFTGTPGALFTSRATGDSEQFVIKYSPDLRMLWSTLLRSNPVVSAVAADGAGGLWLAGEVWETPKAFQVRTLADLPERGFLARLNATGTAVEYGITLPTGGRSASVSVDGSGQVHASLPGLSPFRPGMSVYRYAPLTGRLALQYFAETAGYSWAARDGSTILLTTIDGPEKTGMPQGRLFGSEARVVRLPSEPATADLSVEVNLEQAGAIKFVPYYFFVTVRNRGPHTAQNVGLLLKYREDRPNGNDVVIDQLHCQVHGIGRCSGHSALIPRLASGDAIAIQFWNFPWSNTSEYVVHANLVSESADANLADNWATAELRAVTPSYRPIVTEPSELYFIRDDMATGYYNLARTAQQSAYTFRDRVTVRALTPQVRPWGAGFRFAGWSDGRKDNPRTFSKSDSTEIRMLFDPVPEWMTLPRTLDFVTWPGAPALPVEFTVHPVRERARVELGKPSAPWVHVNESSGVAPAKFIASADPTGLGPGLHRATIPVRQIDQRQNKALDGSVPVTLRISESAPVTSAEAIVDAAGYRPGITAAQIVSIFGEGLGPEQPVYATVPETGPVNTSLAGVEVICGEHRQSILYVQSRQVNFQTWDDSFLIHSNCRLRIGGRDLIVNIRFDPANSRPGVFARDASGKGLAAAVDASTGAMITENNPVRRGQVVSLFVTGLGGSTASSAGGPGQDVAMWPAAVIDAINVSVEIGGRNALVLYAGSTPGYVRSLRQLNVLVPEDCPVGSAIPLRVFAHLPTEARASQDGITLAVGE